MRAAAKKYYDLFPGHFQVRAQRQGLYCYDSATFEDNGRRIVNSAVHGPDGQFRLYPYNETIEWIANRRRAARRLLRSTAGGGSR